jgi:hypothetical protein
MRDTVHTMPLIVLIRKANNDGHDPVVEYNL